MHRPHKAKRTKQISHFCGFLLLIVEVVIFINENFSIKIALCYERNSPLDVPTYTFGQGGCSPSFRPFCTILLKPHEAAANLLSFATASCCYYSNSTFAFGVEVFFYLSAVILIGIYYNRPVLFSPQNITSRIFTYNSDRNICS